MHAVQTLFKKKKHGVVLSKADFMLFRGCKDDRLEVVQKALSLGAHPNARGPENETPICVAAFNGHSRSIRVLACVGADVNAMDKYRGTPLHLAAFNGHMDAVLTLLALKANPQAKNSKHQYPHEVASKDNIKVILQTFRPRKGRTLMHYACKNGNLALVEWIIRGRFGNAVTAWDRDLNAPLHIASSKGFYEICKALLMAGADRSLYNRAKQTPIDVAKDDATRHLLKNYEHHKAAREIEKKREHALAAAREAAEQRQAEEQRQSEETDTSSESSDDDSEKAKNLAFDPFDEFVWSRAHSKKNVNDGTEAAEPPSKPSKKKKKKRRKSGNMTSTAPQTQDLISFDPAEMYANYSTDTHWSTGSPASPPPAQQEQTQPKGVTFKDPQPKVITGVQPFKSRSGRRVQSWHHTSGATSFDPFNADATAQKQEKNSAPTIVVDTPANTEEAALPTPAVQAISAIKRSRRAARLSWSPFDSPKHEE